MGRFALGVSLLLVMLLLGLWVTYTMNAVNEPVSRLLENAAQSALSGDLEQGINLANQARSIWEKSWHGTASVSDHNPMDEIDGMFSQLTVYAQTGNKEAFAAYCARISRLIHAVGEAHSPYWWNLL